MDVVVALAKITLSYFPCPDQHFAMPTCDGNAERDKIASENPFFIFTDGLIKTFINA